MKPHAMCVGLAALLVSLASAVDPAEATQTRPETASPAEQTEAKRKAIDLMLSERESPEKLEAAIRAARALGASEQAVLEARFLYHVDHNDDKKIASLAPDFLARRDTFELDDSEIFGMRDDWLAVVSYVQAMEAAQQGDEAAFKRHITEAFWLSPRQGVIFAPQVERIRREQAMRKTRVDLDSSFSTLTGERVKLADLLNSRKAMLLHFFSPWSNECEESLPDFLAAQASLTKADIAVVTVIGELAPEARQDTLKLLKDHKVSEPGVWVLDNARAPLARLLQVRSAPVMVLVASDGSILFNGDPTEDQLWETIATLAPGFSRPPAPTHEQ